MDRFELAYNKALRFLSYRQRSEKEVRDNLLKKSRGGYVVGSDIVELVIAKLKEQKFLNDQEFARMWRESRLRSKPKSERLIQIELRQKGITKDIIDSLQEAHASVDTDLVSAKKIVEKKIGRVKHLSRQEIYQKLGNLLASRGFDWDTIKHAIDEVLGKEYNTNE